MFFSQPFILASDFVQHVVLLVSCGVVALGYCMHKDTARTQYGLLAMAVLVATFWIVVEYFVPVKLLQFHLFMHIPLALALLAFLYRIDVVGLPRMLAPLRHVLASVVILHAAVDVLQVLALFLEPYLLRSILKTAEVSILYVFVLQFARHYRMQQQTTTQSSNMITRSVAQAVIAVLIFFSAAPSVNAFSLTTRIGDQSTELLAGDRLYFDVEIKWPENDRRQDLRVEYQILSEGQVIASEKVLRAVETQASFLDYIVVPQNAPEGIKNLNVVIETYDKSLNETISASFYVTAGENKMLVYFIILAAAIGLIVVLVIVQITLIMRTQRAMAPARA